MHFTIKIRISHPITNKLIYNYSRADTPSITADMENFIVDYSASFERGSVEENWAIYKYKILSLIDRFVPKLNMVSNAQSPWYNNLLKWLKNKRKRHRSRRSECTDRDDHWSAYCQLRPSTITLFAMQRAPFLSLHYQSYCIQNIVNSGVYLMDLLVIRFS